MYITILDASTRSLDTVQSLYMHMPKIKHFTSLVALHNYIGLNKITLLFPAGKTTLIFVSFSRAVDTLLMVHLWKVYHMVQLLYGSIKHTCLTIIHHQTIIYIKSKQMLWCAYFFVTYVYSTLPIIF